MMVKAEPDGSNVRARCLYMHHDDSQKSQQLVEPVVDQAVDLGRVTLPVGKAKNTHNLRQPPRLDARTKSRGMCTFRLQRRRLALPRAARTHRFVTQFVPQV